MAESENGGKGLKKRIGPLSAGGWLASVGGALVLFVMIKRYQAARTTSTGSAGGSSVLTGGGIIPPGSLQGPTSGAASFSSYGAWLQAALAQITSTSGLDAGQALDGITTWLGGGCVNQAQYTGITSVIGTTNIGLPPGWGTSIPALSVCANPATGGGGTTPPPTPTPAASPLTTLNAQTFAKQVLYGQYAPGDYTKVGTVNNGSYSGYGVSGGAPVYAGLFGGFVQDFNMATLPNGTDLYVPTELLPYVNGYPQPAAA